MFDEEDGVEFGIELEDEHMTFCDAVQAAMIQGACLVRRKAWPRSQTQYAGIGTTYCIEHMEAIAEDWEVCTYD